MSRRLTVNDLVAEVRSVLDEVNTENIRDVEDILPALNRGQDYAASTLARRYAEPLLTYTTIPLTLSESEYDVPTDALEDRIEKIEIRVNSDFYELKRISFRDITDYEYPRNTDVPRYYVILNDKFRVLPPPSAGYDMRVWYLQDPAPLELSQGQVRTINPAGNYLLVDDIGDSLSTNVDDLNSYVNFVDGVTGRITKTMQVQSLSDGRITFKSTPSRTSVLGRTVSGSFTADDIQPDDYVCTVHGTCVPFIKKPLANFLINFAVTEIKINKLGGDAQLLPQQLGAFEKQLEKMWVGQEQTLRVKRVNRNFENRQRRRYLWNRTP